jgi:hypothetical protein
MQKPRPQSTQAPSCTTFFAWNFFSFPTPFKPFWGNSFEENQHIPEVQIHLDGKIKQDLNKNQGKKCKLNAVAEKENTRWNDKSEKWVFLANEKRSISLSKHIMWSNYLLQQTKQKKTKNKSKDAPRKMHNAWSNKNIIFWKVTWFLSMKKGYLGGIVTSRVCNKVALHHKHHPKFTLKFSHLNL